MTSSRSSKGRIPSDYFGVTIKAYDQTFFNQMTTTALMKSFMPPVKMPNLAQNIEPVMKAFTKDVSLTAFTDINSTFSLKAELPGFKQAMLGYRQQVEQMTAVASGAMMKNYAETVSLAGLAQGIQPIIKAYSESFHITSFGELFPRPTQLGWDGLAERMAKVGQFDADVEQALDTVFDEVVATSTDFDADRSYLSEKYSPKLCRLMLAAVVVLVWSYSFAMIRIVDPSLIDDLAPGVPELLLVGAIATADRIIPILYPEVSKDDDGEV